MWNRATGEPIYNAIVWQDRRAEPTCAALREQGLEPTFRAKTGLIVDAYFSATKLKWILDNVDGARAAAARGELAFGTVDSWLMWHLTGGQVHATDVSNASRTLMLDVHTNTWDDELLRILDVPRALLPDVHRRAMCTATRCPTCSARAFPSAAWRATSRAPSSARRASAPASRRTPTAPAASC